MADQNILNMLSRGMNRAAGKLKGEEGIAARFDYLIDEFQNAGLSLKEDDYQQIIKRPVNLVVWQYADSLLSAWKRIGYASPSKCLLGVFNALVTDMNTMSGSDDLLDCTIIGHIQRWAPICNQLIGTDYETNARKLMRILGKCCDDMAQFGRVANKMPVGMDWKIGDSFADGAIAKAGSMKVGLFYAENTGKGVIMPQAKPKQPRNPDAIKAEIHARCINGASDQMIRERAELLFELGEVIGALEAKAWFEDKYPHLVSSM